MCNGSFICHLTSTVSTDDEIDINLHCANIGCDKTAYLMSIYASWFVWNFTTHSMGSMQVGGTTSETEALKESLLRKQQDSFSVVIHLRVVLFDLYAPHSPL